MSRIERSPEKIWCYQTPSGSGLLEEVLESIASRSGVLIFHTEQMPWKEYIQSYLFDHFSENDWEHFSRKLKTPREDIGRHLLKNYCDKKIQQGCRAGMSAGEYLAGLHMKDATQLPRSTFFTVCDNRQQASRWVRFLSEYYHKGRKDKAVFVVLCPDKPETGLPKNTKVFDIRDYIQEYDVHSFYSMLAAGLGQPDGFKKYSAELALQLAPDDLEAGAACMRRGMEFISGPASVYISVLEDLQRTVPEEISAVVRKAQWNAQIRILYGIIEEYRQKLLSLYGPRIDQIIHTSFADLDLSYSHIVQAEDAEIGEIASMIQNRLLIVSQEIYSSYNVFRNARNSLSHLQPVEVQDLEYLLEYASHSR